MRLPRRSVERLVAAFGQTELGDPRRTRRVVQLVERLAQAPHRSLPAALGTDAQVQGAYRLMNNPAVTFEKLLVPQALATARRAQEARRVLVISDTTDCSFPNLDPEDVGFLNTGKAGFRLHVSMVVDADAKRPLGVIHAETLFRARRSRMTKKKMSGPETAQQADRESARWWRGMEASGRALSAHPHVVHVADREGDSYELLARLVEAKQKFVIRVRVDRRGRAVEADDTSWSTVRKVAANCDGVLERDVPLSRRIKKSAPRMNIAHPPRKARVARLRFSAASIVIPRPHYVHEPAPKELSLNLVHVTEVDSPEGEPAVEWLLYTNEPTSTPSEIETIVDTYRLRWLIEEFNGALKTGCVYEEREFESRDALLTMLALSLPIACEVLWLRSRSRTAADAPATEVVTPLQLKILRKLGSYRLPQKPTAQDAMLAVAALGGHLKRNGAPGWKVIQRGMTDLVAYQRGWEAATS